MIYDIDEYVNRTEGMSIDSLAACGCTCSCYCVAYLQENYTTGVMSYQGTGAMC
jgi:hypothetical protein